MPSREDEAQSVIRNAYEGMTVALGPNRVTFLVRGEDTGGRYSLTEFTLAPPPAPGPPMHVHKAEDEAGYVLEGELDVTISERTTRATVGTYFSVPRGTLHTVANPGPGPATELFLLTPPGFEGYWEESAQLLEASGGAADPERMRALQEKYNVDMRGEVRRFSAEN